VGGARSAQGSSLAVDGRRSEPAASPAVNRPAFYGDGAPRLPYRSGARTLPFGLERSWATFGAVALGAATFVGGAVSLGPVAGLGALIAVALALVVALRPRVGIFLLVAIVPVVSGVRRGLPIPGFRPSELLIVGVAAVLLVMASGRRPTPWKALDWLLLAYALGTLGLGSVDLYQRGAPFTSSDLGTLVGPFQFLLLYRALTVTVRTARERCWCLRLLLLSSLPVSALAILQQFGLPGLSQQLLSLTNFAQLAGTGPDSVSRATGPFPHWHDLAGYLLVVILVAAALLLRERMDVLSRRRLVLVVAIAVVALVETLSIGPILATVAGVVLLAVWSGRASRGLLGLAVAAVVAGLLFAPLLQGRYRAQFTARAPGTERSTFVPQTIAYRVDLWKNVEIPAMSGNWATGYGPDLPPKLRDFPYTESLYFTMLFRGGVPLLLIFVGLMSALALAARAARAREGPEQPAIGRVVVIVVVALALLHAQETYLIDSGTPHVLWVLVGLLAFHESIPRPWRQLARGGAARAAT